MVRAAAGMTRQLLPLLLLHAACAVTADATGGAKSVVEVLAVVGDVTTQEVRVLVDIKAVTRGSRHRASGISDVMARLTLLEGPGTPQRSSDPKEASVLVKVGIPSVLKVTGLRAGVRYVGAVEALGADIAGDTGTVEFTTLRYGRVPDIAVVSCNRYNEDRDTRAWGALDSMAAPPELVYHIGDQVYTDRLERQCKAAPGVDTCREYPAAYRSYRSFYWDAWTAPNASLVLRKRGNIMLGDDHDVLSNLQALTYSEQKYRPYVAAGVLAYYFFQVQLVADIPDAVGKTAIACIDGTDPDACSFQLIWKLIRAVPSFRHRKYGYSEDMPALASLDVVMLDTRFDRMLGYDAAALWPKEQSASALGVRQKMWMDRLLENILERWRKDEPRTREFDVKADGLRRDVIIISQVPLLFHPPLAAKIADAFEKEIYPTHEARVETTAQALEGIWKFKTALHEAYPKSTVTLVAGDLHIYAEGNVCGVSGTQPAATAAGSGGSCMKQIVTSGLTSGSTSQTSPHLMAFHLFTALSAPAALPEPVSPSRLEYRPDTSRYDFGRNVVMIRGGGRKGRHVGEDIDGVTVERILLDVCEGPACGWTDLNTLEKAFLTNFTRVVCTLALALYVFCVSVPRYRRLGKERAARAELREAARAKKDAASGYMPSTDTPAGTRPLGSDESNVGRGTKVKRRKAAVKKSMAASH